MVGMTRWIVRGSLVLTFCIAPLALGQGLVLGSATAGAQKAATCLGCHGPNGNSINPMWPKLAGQNVDYLENQLRQFRDKTRIDPSGVMPAIAATLSDQDIANLAAYFSMQTPTGLEADPSTWKAGEQLYRGGDAKRGIPACMACHGPTGAGNPAAGYPALHAQQGVYVIQQLTEYAADRRYTHNTDGSSNGGHQDEIMHTIASHLTPQDMQELASYVQGLR